MDILSFIASKPQSIRKSDYNDSIEIVTRIINKAIKNKNEREKKLHETLNNILDL